MKRILFIVTLLFSTLIIYAQDVASQNKFDYDTFDQDSLQHLNLEEFVVSATRADKNTPMAYSNINQSTIRKNSTARNIPIALQTTPSLIAFTEDGLGIGNTSLRIRGTDATRINVTLNGMPLNNPESQEVYWVNLPDIASSLQSIQVQRGIGTSTSGSAAFGASISMKTTGARSKAYGEASTAIGSYGTYSSTIAAGTGMLDNGLSFDARYSRNIGSGYIRNGSIDHHSIYAAVSYYGDNQMLRLSYINGDQKTGITWEGISPEELEKHGPRYNPAGKYIDDAGNTRYYDNETDNYKSNILQLTYSLELNQDLSLNAGLSYNNGYGYYENYRYNRRYSDFGLEPQTIDGNTYSRTDFIRRKMLSNDFYVANLSTTYTAGKAKITGGAMYSYFDGDHMGRLPWVKHNNNIAENYEWYLNHSYKSEISAFAKVDYQLNSKLSLFGDLQYRHIYYRLKGLDDDMVELDGRFHYNFFNPKAGIFYNIDRQNSLYASVAVANREPLRSDLKDGIKGGAENPIRPERMIDYEAGYKYNADNGLRLGLNFYYMDYHNQMVPTGKLSDSGYKLLENVKHSYRTGIEGELSLPFANDRFLLNVNATLSQNRIKNHTAYYDLYDNLDNYGWNGQVAHDLGNTPISYSPNMTAMGSLTYTPINRLYFNIIGQYVGKQYLDNTGNDEKAIDDYFVTNISAGYTLPKTGFGTIALQVIVNNLFSHKYIANGWASTDQFEDGSSVNWIGYYPQATRNLLVRATISF